MDHCASGPMWLKDPTIAQCVLDTFLLAEQKWELYELFAWVLMANHVHVVLAPHRPVPDITRAIKKTSARRANQLLGRVGLPFWQDESYDHWVRDDRELQRIIRYIEANPVRAGLVERIEDWFWSSAASRFQEGQVGNLPHRYTYLAAPGAGTGNLTPAVSR